MRSTRVLAIGVVGVSLATMGLVDQFVDRPITKLAAAANEAGTLDPIASAVNSGSSLWFCPSGESADGADTTITIVNPTKQAGTGSVSFLGNAGQRATANVQIGAYARLDVRAAETLSAAGVGAIVEVNVGGLAVEQKVIRGNQTYGASCATSTGTAWYFADGDTTLGASSVLSVLNPFGEDAVLDISFVTERGAARPNDLQGFLVPASSLRRIDIGTYVRRRSQVSTVVKARVGRVAVDQTTSPDGTRFSIVNGAPALGSSWYFPAGRTNGVLRERYVLFNPTAKDVSAQIDVVVEGGEVEPFELDVPARSRVDLVPNEESRIARDADYSVVVATDSSSLVVQRTLRASGIYRAGFATTLGSRRSATDWIVPDVVASASRDDTISILNPTDTPTAISLTLNSGGESETATSATAATSNAIATGTVEPSVDGKAPVVLAGAENLLVKGSSRVTIRLSDFAAVASGSLVVRSSAAEIVVERTATAIKRRARRTDRPTYLLADADSLAVRVDTSDTLPQEGNVGSDLTSETAADGLPVGDTYGADTSIAEIPSSSADSTVAAATAIVREQKPVLRFGEFFVVTQTPASTTSGAATVSTATTIRPTVSSTSSASEPTGSPSIVSTSRAGTSSTRAIPAPVPSTAGTSTTATAATATATTFLPTTIVAATPNAPVTTEKPAATTIVSRSTTSTSTTVVETALLAPKMGLGPVAKAGTSTFSAVAIPIRPAP